LGLFLCIFKRAIQQLSAGFFVIVSPFDSFERGVLLRGNAIEDNGQFFQIFTADLESIHRAG